MAFDFPLRHYFEWTQFGHLAAANLQKQYISSVASAVGAVISRVKDRDVFARITRQLRDLPNSGLLRILSSPELCWWLVNSGKTFDEVALAEFLRRSIAVEAFLQGQKPDLKNNERLWSALGDFQIIASGDALFQKRTAIAAPVIGRIPLDGQSDHATRSPVAAAGENLRVRAYSDTEMTKVRNKLVSAVATLNEACPHAFSFLDTVTAVICCHCDENEPDFFTSGSSRSLIGQILLVNPHLQSLNISVFVSALLHEAIHSFLYRVELERPLVEAMVDGWRLQVVSPWSGNSLRLTTYIHACYVYYGLVCFWHRSSAHVGFDRETITVQLVSLKNGFIRNRLRLRQIKDYREKLQTGLLDDLHVMTETAIERLTQTGVGDDA